ncbi:TIGR03618 family F420-dependent PPOX class oxidoreductase [Actinomadura rudentiformis]|uniref:TIGR03618 family F420-dependent PPOX class oxidoreductase n=1 Tax=Actinomadura rudentiformis TaxID=359158 RepID=A0A6H9Z0E5_9ACTN|nr:TIGR03618 family F420-dependent PPOX class oxidoreductase [Actinomadura rudentiformis]KAB2347916.1 TIGR03618 family F420-dependent PPOX class oxidoreductase [Actinomadura rudentiformis]
MTKTETETETEYGPGQGPGARLLSEEEIDAILTRGQFGVLATVKRSGHPHLASMVYTWDAAARMIRISSAEGRIKVRHLERDPRAVLHVQGDTVLSYAVAEGQAEVSEVSTVAGDATSRELLAMTGGFADPADEAAFLEQVAKDRRVVLRLRVERVYGTALDAPAGS